MLGTTSCTTGVPVCTDSVPKPDGTLCNGTLTCTLGECLPASAINASVNLTTDPLTPGRTCGEAPTFAVTSLTATVATVATAPGGDCLVAGDEVMVINLQGTPSSTTNVGNWELLRVAGVSGMAITFTAPKTRSYGDSLDENIGSMVGQHKVALIRVPRFGTFTVQAGATITASPWNGKTGGVVVLRAGAFVIDGTITAAKLGYREGRSSSDNIGCANNLITETGESISGPPVIATTRNTGGSGGIDAFTGRRFDGNTPISPSAGHATAGQPGLNANGRTLGQPGAAYGVADGTQLTMGSGIAGNLTCRGDGGPLMYVAPGPQGAGGIIVLIGGDMQFGTMSSVTATAQPAPRDGAASGGYVYLRGHDLSLGTSRVTARGAVARGGSPSTTGVSNVGGLGYIAIRASGAVTGTTDPAAVVVP